MRSPGGPQRTFDHPARIDEAGVEAKIVTLTAIFDPIKNLKLARGPGQLTVHLIATTEMIQRRKRNGNAKRPQSEKKLLHATSVNSWKSQKVLNLVAMVMSAEARTLLDLLHSLQNVHDPEVPLLRLCQKNLLRQLR